MDLGALERACEIVVRGNPDPTVFGAANAQIMQLQSNVENIPVLQSVFDASTNSCAVLVAARCLLQLITDHWNAFTEPQRVEIRDYLLNFLGQKGPQLEEFAVKGVVALIVRITKFGWFDAESPAAAPGPDGTVPPPASMKSLAIDTTKFLQATVHHCVIGLRILNDLVTEMNYKNKNRSMTQHRKVAVAFRDLSLFQVFEISLTMLNQVATRSIALDALAPAEAERVESKILEESLQLLVACLSFDFLGSNPDEDVADTTSIQVPATWRERLQSGSTLRVLFNLYKGCTLGRISIIPDAPAPAVGAAAGASGGAGTPGGMGGSGMGSGGDKGARPAGALFGYKPFSGMAAGGPGAATTREMRRSPARAAQCLEALNLMVAVRRSLFNTEGDRKRFLGYILRGVCEILKEEAGFTDEQCFHNFAKLLSKVKNSFQLSELVGSEGYAEWIALTAQFTIKCCGQPVWSQNSMHYILSLWTRLVSSVPYMQAEYSTKGAGARLPDTVFDPYIPKIIQAYVRGRLDALASADEAEREQVLAQLDDLETIEDELDQLPSICRYAYEGSALGLTALMDPILQRYNDGLTFLRTAAATQPLDAALGALRMLEVQLAWLTAIIGAVVGGAGSSSGSYYSSYFSASFGGGAGGTGASGGAGSAAGSGMGDEAVDADLTRRVLQLMQAVDMRVSAAAAGVPAAGAATNPLIQMMRVDSRLELSFIYFLSNFRKAYVNEQGGLPATFAGSAITGGSAAGGVGAKPAGLLSAAPRSAAEAAAQAAAAVAAEQPSLQELYAAATGRQKVFLAMIMRMGLGDHTVVVSVMITKLMSNLRFWPERADIIDRTLDVLNELIFSYTSGRLLLQLDVINTLLLNHSEEAFPFLAVPAMVRQRTLFHQALARLVFMEDESEKFEPFIAPIVGTLEKLSGVAHVRSAEVMRSIIGVSRDLRGILAAAHNRPTYLQVFEAIFPRHVQTLISALSTWWDTPAVTTSILKCLDELCYNRGQRITFGSSSANGILLFREACSAMSGYGQRIASITPPPHEAYASKYKGIAVALSMFSRCLDGGYVNFGVFALYGDPALNNGFETALKLMLSLPQDDVMSHTKFSVKWLSFLTNAFRSHMDVLVSLDTPSFMQLIQTLTAALDSLDTEVSSQAAYSLDFFASYYVRNAKKDTPAMAALRAHLSAQPSLFEALMKVVFQVVVFGDIGSAWSLPRPLLSLILAAEAVRPNCFEEFRNEVVAMQPADLQARMAEEFGKLMKDVHRTLDAVNRDRFQNRVTIFRVAVKEFAKPP